jgi:hypothetical protein
MLARDERVAILETTVNEHTMTFVAMRDAFAHLEQRIDTRLDRLENTVSRQFVWTVGIQVTILLAVIGALVTVVGMLAPH